MQLPRTVDEVEAGDVVVGRQQVEVDHSVSPGGEPSDRVENERAGEIGK